MTTERDIAGHFHVLKALMLKANKRNDQMGMTPQERAEDRQDMATSIEAGLILLEIVVTDLHRIADAVEIDAKFPLNTVNPS